MFWLSNAGYGFSALLKQHACLLVFEWIGRDTDAGEQGVTALVVLTVLDQLCCCQGDLLGQSTLACYRIYLKGNFALFAYKA